MNINQISSLFTLFSGETDTETYRPLIDSAIAQVERRLKEDVQDSDAIANFRYSQITCVKNKIAYTYAGTADSKGNSQLEYDFARELMREYYKAASDLLYDDGFIFTAVCCG